MPVMLDNFTECVIVNVEFGPLNLIHSASYKNNSFSGLQNILSRTLEVNVIEMYVLCLEICLSDISS